MTDHTDHKGIDIDREKLTQALEVLLNVNGYDSESHNAAIHEYKNEYGSTSSHGISLLKPHIDDLTTFILANYTPKARALEEQNTAVTAARIDTARALLKRLNIYGPGYAAASSALTDIFGSYIGELQRQLKHQEGNIHE